jgi:hypothetical protein
MMATREQGQSGKGRIITAISAVTWPNTRDDLAVAKKPRCRKTTKHNESDRENDFLLAAH